MNANAARAVSLAYGSDLAEPAADGLRVRLQETSGHARYRQPVRMGIPVARGQVHDVDRLGAVATAGGDVHAAQLAVLSRWSDHSVRWLTLEALVSLDAHAELLIEVGDRADRGDPVVDADEPALVEQVTADGLRVDTGYAVFDFATARGEVGIVARGSAPAVKPVLARLELRDADDKPVCERVRWQGSLLSRSSDRLTWVYQGTLDLAGVADALSLWSSWTVYRASARVDHQIRVHNPARAAHPDGYWDIGDPASCRFASLSTVFDCPAPASLSIALDDAAEATRLEPGQTVEFAQGAIASQAVRPDRERAEAFVPPWSLIVSGERKAIVERPTPRLSLHVDGIELALRDRHFWQNWPSGFSATPQSLQIDWFAPMASALHELQPGEQKTRELALVVADHAVRGLLHEAPIAVLSPAQLDRSEVLSPVELDGARQLDELIDTDARGAERFLAKREAGAEYGWRNFGEVYADHETLYQETSEPPHVSHYNNQYDAVLGFLLQFLQRGDPRWWQLADDLARHVSDIDVYQTVEDRAEYSGGLFWHTNHYVDAATSTHRTFSKHSRNRAGEREPGGGPAAEHCYTTGLLLHYRLSGYDSSRRAVESLIDWICRCHDGDGTVLSTLHGVARRDLPRLRASLSGDTTRAFRYPLTRATGNYLVALLDAHDLQDDTQWLARAGRVIEQTAHPRDDLRARHLDNIERTWSYLVFLQAVGRYLTRMETQLPEADLLANSDYRLAIGVLGHYAEWMLREEQPYLQSVERLEFPNDTWVAQDIRKANVLTLAAEYDSANADGLREAARHYLDHVTQHLASSNTLAFSRIQIVLMQNTGLQGRLDRPRRVAPLDRARLGPFEPPSGTHPGSLIAGMTRDLLAALRTLDWQRERRWLRDRGLVK